MNPAKNSLRVRGATRADMDRIVEIHTFAFPDGRSHDARVKNFCAKPFGGLERLRVVIDSADRIVAHAFLFDLETFIGGRAVRTAAIATVGVEPASRGLGVATHLLSSLHAEAKREGASLALLFAWRQGFYAKNGYAPTTPYQRLEVSTRSLPREKRDAIRVRAANGDDRAVIETAYARACSQSTGFLRRSSAMWDAAFVDEKLAWVVDPDEQAACAYRLVQSEPHAKVVAEVEHLFSPDAKTPRCMLTHLASLADQVAEVHVSLPWNDPLGAALIDGDAHRFGDATVEHTLGRVCGGPMLNALDVGALLSSRGYAIDGKITLQIDSVKYKVVARDGSGAVSVVNDSAIADVQFHRNAASVIAGGVPLEDAITHRWASAANDATIARAHALLTTSPFFTLDSF